MATDGELLKRYVTTGDEGAFGRIVARHGPMVRAACERLAGPDADDAAQAVFILLARKARKLTGWRDVALWLHGACRYVARTARRERVRRAAREKEAAAMFRAQAEAEVSARDREVVREQLDQAVAALPERFREVVLLCHLQGASQQDVAERLGLPLGTVASRAKRGLERLRRRLAGGGAALGVAALAGLLAEGATGAIGTFNAEALLSSVMAASKVSAAGAAAGTAGLLAKGAMQAMFWTKVKLATAAIAAVTVLGSTVPLTVAAVQGAEGDKGKGERVVDGEPAPPPAPMPGGAKVMIFTGEQVANTGKVRDKDLLRATAEADLVAVVKVAKIEDHQVEKKADPNAAAGFGGMGVLGAMSGKDKKVSGDLLEVLRGEEAAKSVGFLVAVSGEGKAARVVFQQKHQLGDPATGVRVFTRSTSVPLTLAVGKKSLVFLKLEKEVKDDAGKVTERVYRLLPPLIDGATKETLASVRKALAKVKEWESAPELTEKQAARIDGLIGQLNDDDFKVRELATKSLIAEGQIVRGKVREALKSDDAETKARARQVLDAVQPDWLKAEKGPRTSTGPDGTTIIRGAGGGKIKIQMKVGK